MSELTLVKDRSREFAQKFGENIDDFLSICEVKAEATHDCKNPLTVSWVDNKGYPVNCFTMESLWGHPESKVQKMPLSGQIQVWLIPLPENYIPEHEPVQVHILLHDSHSLENPIREGITLHAGKNYEIFIKQRVMERLPAPYETNCRHYIELWKRNGGYGPLTGSACLEQCEMENMLETRGCVSQRISYPGNYKICEEKRLQISIDEDIIEKCSLQCNDACREITYDITRHEVTSDNTRRCKNGDQNCLYHDLTIDFLFHRMEVEKTVNQPRYESIEVFSYIGGYMGMWLGLSLVAVFDFMETLVFLASYMFRGKKKRSTVHKY